MMMSHRIAPMLSVAMFACAIEPPSTSSIEAAASDRAVVPEKELVITDPSVIAAPDETTFDPQHPSGTTRRGAWTFGRLVHNMLPQGQRDSAAAASQLVLRWLATWETAQLPNPDVTAALARPSIRLLITNPWKAASGCAQPASPATDATCVLDMAKAPFKLMAIFYRPDLRIVAGDDRSIGGEGRFVFQVVGPTIGIDVATGVMQVIDPTAKAQKFTVIFEYSLPVQNDGQTITWASRWHDLGAKPFGTAFNAHLLTLTRDFSGPDRDTRRPNGNALDQLRTNEVALQGTRSETSSALPPIWELREFHLTAAGLTPHTMNLEPSRDFDVFKSTFTAPEGTRSAELVEFLDANSAAVLGSQFTLPAGMSGNSSVVGAAPYGAWGKLTNPNPPAIPAQGVEHALEGVAIEVRDSFAINTCAGCHRHETDTRHFMHVTFIGAISAADRARIGMADAADGDVGLSNFLREEVSPGGARFEDFTVLLTTKRNDLRDKPGLRACR